MTFHCSVVNSGSTAVHCLFSSNDDCWVRGRGEGSNYQTADTDIDIYCTYDAAPYLRAWLIGPSVDQLFAGYSEVNKAFQLYPSSLTPSWLKREHECDPVSHVEFFMNKESDNVTSVHSSLAVLEFGRVVHLVTNDTKPLPFMPYTDRGNNKKGTVNIDVIVLKVRME